jgi:hypothetical protein
VRQCINIIHVHLSVFGASLQSREKMKIFVVEEAPSLKREAVVAAEKRSR